MRHALVRDPGEFARIPGMKTMRGGRALFRPRMPPIKFVNSLKLFNDAGLVVGEIGKRGNLSVGNRCAHGVSPHRNRSGMEIKVVLDCAKLENRGGILFLLCLLACPHVGSLRAAIFAEYSRRRFCEVQAGWSGAFESWERLFWCECLRDDVVHESFMVCAGRSGCDGRHSPGATTSHYSGNSG